MNKIQRAAREVMVGKLVGDVVRQHIDTARAAAHGLMATAGVERVRVKDDVGTDFGTVSFAAGRPAAKVTDEQAFLRWVVARYPTEVEQVVRAAFRKRLLDAVTGAGDPVDTSTGEVIPGVEVVAGKPYLVVRSTAEAQTRISATLTVPGLLAIADLASDGEGQ